MTPGSIPYPYLVIEGNIGAGKTSLANIIANKFNTSIVLETFAENTFLPQFYQQPERFAFPLEMSFLADRFQQIRQEQESSFQFNKILVGDYIFEKSLLFARVTLNPAEFELFKKFFELIAPALRPPDLLIYLHRSTGKLLENIAKRGREYEKNIQASYLENISKSYLEYIYSIKNQRVIIIEGDQLDFVENPSHLRFLLDVIQAPHPEKLQTIQLRS